jgi:hypothetical protein
MPSLRYALVAYVKSPVGEFVENLRRELHPAMPHLAAHITFLPPRPPAGYGTARRCRCWRGVCGQAEPFRSDARRRTNLCSHYSHGLHSRDLMRAARLQELHDQLNTQALAFRRRVALHSLT